MDLWESSKNAFYSAVTVALFFSLVAIIVIEALSFATGLELYPTDMVRLDWGTKLLSNAIEKLQSGIAVNIILAIPQFVLGVAAILVQLLVNSLTLINWLIKQALHIILSLIVLSDTYVEQLAGIISWIVETPIILGAMMAIGQAIYTFISGVGKV